MKIKRNLITGISDYFKSIVINHSEFDYAVNYGFLAVILLIVKQLITIINSTNNSNILNGEMYTPFILLVLLFVALLYIKIKKISSDNKIANTLMILLPFFIIVVGLSMIHSYIEYNNKLLTFVMLIMILCWLQIYNNIRRIIIFVVTPVLYMIINHGIYETNQLLFFNIIAAIIVSSLAFLSATIIYRLHYSNQVVITNLDSKNQNFEKSILELRKTHKSLSISKKITDSMYELTQEVLKNENLEDVLQMVLDKAAKLIPNSQAGTILLNYDGIMKFEAASGYNLDNLKKTELKYEETYQASLDDKYEPFIIRNLEVFDNAAMGEEKTKELYERATTIAKSCMTCSFKYQGEFFGSINIDNFDSETAFNNHDKILIKQLSQEIEIIISIHKLYEQALRPTKYDELTQAKTRRYCTKLINNLVSNNLTENLTVCTIDINNLKKVNDKYGHDAGDKLLFEFAEAVRNSEIEENIFGRVGGDEFLIAFQTLSVEEVEMQFIKIKQYLKKHLFKMGKEKIDISFAHGIAVFGIDGDNILDLYKLSDKRMYQDKSVQKNIKKK